MRTDLVPGEADFEKDGIPRAFDCNLDAPTYRSTSAATSGNPDQDRVDPAGPAARSSPRTG